MDFNSLWTGVKNIVIGGYSFGTDGDITPKVSVSTGDAVPDGEGVNETEIAEERALNPWNPVVLRALVPFVGATGGSDALQQLRLVSQAFNDAVMVMPHPTPICLNIAALYPEICEECDLFDEDTHMTPTPPKQIQDVDHKLARNVRMGMSGDTCSRGRISAHHFAEYEDPEYGKFPRPVMITAINFMNFCQAYGSHIVILKLTAVLRDLKVMAIAIDRHLPNVRSIAVEKTDCHDCECHDEENSKPRFKFNTKRSLVKLKFVNKRRQVSVCRILHEMAKALVEAAPNLRQLQVDSHSGSMFFDLSGHKQLRDLHLDFNKAYPRDDCLTSVFCLRNLRIRIKFVKWFPETSALIEQFRTNMEIKKVELELRHEIFNFKREEQRCIETLSEFKKALRKLEKSVMQIENLVDFVYIYVYV